MKSLKIKLLVALAIVCCSPLATRAESQDKTLLNDGWTIQSGDLVTEPGDALSRPDFKPEEPWHQATVPSTVVGTLVDDKVYPDPFFGMNLKELSTNNAFKGAWWYRKEFKVSVGQFGQAWLHFDGINYRANIWLNGKQIADTNQVVGAYRTYQFNITSALAHGAPNVLAIEIFPADKESLGINWVDWNPTPPDKNMGLWRDVYVTTTGPVALHNVHLVSKVDPNLAKARLIVSADLENTFYKAVGVTLDGSVGDLSFSKSVVIQPYEIAHVEFNKLTMNKPKLWWPVHMGDQNLYELNMKATVDTLPSDEDVTQVGIREVTSELNDKGFRVFKVNGKPILIRGGGWAPDMFLRPSPERELQEIRYVKDMNLNAIRFEGKTESDRFLNLCDKEGILVIAGWCCCDYWEQWSKWKDNDYDIAAYSLRDQVVRLRNHPSMLTFWYGSDNPPNERAESNYLAVLKQFDWPNPAQSSASGHKPAISEPTGMKMSGPYEYVPPMYW